MAYNQLITDALSPLSNSNQPTLHFATCFGSGVSLGAMTEATPGLFYTQNVSGTDAVTGCTFPDSLYGLMGNNTTTQIQLIPDLAFIGTGSIDGTVLIITSVSSGALTNGSTIDSTNGAVINGTTISSFGTGIGGIGTYNLDTPQNVSSATIVSPGYTAANVTANLEAILQSTTAPVRSGSRELYIPVHNRKFVGGTNSRPQGIFMVTRNGTGGQPPASLQEFYVSTVRFLPADLATIMSYAYGSNYYTIWDYKTGGYGGGNAFGDYRISLIIGRAATGGLYYKFSADNNANGNWNGSSGIPSVGTVNVTGSNPDGYWAYRTSQGSAETDLGCWIRTHLYVKRPQIINVRSSDIESGARDPMYQQDITTGITYCAIENLTNNTFTVIGNKVGGRQMGCENLPFARMMNITTYCTATSASDPIVYSKATDLQIWNRPPIYLPPS